MDLSMPKEPTDYTCGGLDVGGEKPHGGPQRRLINENSSGGVRRRKQEFEGNVLFVLMQI